MEQRITAPKGCKIDSVEHDDNSVVIMFSEDKPKFKKGDFLTGEFRNYDNSQETVTLIYGSDSYATWYVDVFAHKRNINFRLATEEEKQSLLEHFHKTWKDWDEENLKFIPYVWKPQKGEKYWLIYHYFEVRFTFYDPNNNSCFNNIKDYNFFKTEKEALKYAEELKRILKERKL